MVFFESNKKKIFCFCFQSCLSIFNRPCSKISVQMLPCIFVCGWWQGWGSGAPKRLQAFYTERLLTPVFKQTLPHIISSISWQPTKIYFRLVLDSESPAKRHLCIVKSCSSYLTADLWGLWVTLLRERSVGCQWALLVIEVVSGHHGCYLKATVHSLFWNKLTFYLVLRLEGERERHFDKTRWNFSEGSGCFLMSTIGRCKTQYHTSLLITSLTYFNQPGRVNEAQLGNEADHKGLMWSTPRLPTENTCIINLVHKHMNILFIWTSWKAQNNGNETKGGSIRYALLFRIASCSKDGQKISKQPSS